MYCCGRGSTRVSCAVSVPRAQRRPPCGSAQAFLRLQERLLQFRQGTGEAPADFRQLALHQPAQLPVVVECSGGGNHAVK
jgi:hypothetical protein